MTSPYDDRWTVRHHDADGHEVTVVVPDRPAAGRPWLWRAEFLGAFDGADRAMLERGWHLVYVSVQDRYGDDLAMDVWERAYQLVLTEHGLHPAPALEGLSRGALYAMSWAARHPDRVLALSLDNPACDLRTWPREAYRAEWHQLLRIFGVEDPDSAEGAATLLAHSPLARYAAPAAAGVPLLLVYGDADEDVPSVTNAEVLGPLYRAAGGEVTMIVKPGYGHHPHGLDDQPGGLEPVVRFLEAALASRG